MPLWKWMPKGTWKPTKKKAPLRPRKRILPNLPTRRTLLKIGLAATLFGVLTRDVNRILSPIIRTGRPFTLKETLENYSGIRTGEYGFYKQRGKPGQIKPATHKSEKRELKWKDPMPEDTHQIHNHPFYPNDQLERQTLEKMSQLPSPGDLENLFTTFKKVRDEKLVQFGKLRVSSIACFNEDGKVIGYISFRIGKKMLEKDNLDVAIRAVISADVVLKSFPSENTDKYARFVIETAEKAILQLRDLGLQYHTKSMPGYEYKSGYFQKIK